MRIKLLILATILLAGCAPKTSVSQPQPLNIAPLEEERTFLEAFRVDSLVVNSYGYREDETVMWGALYYFYVFEDKELVRRIELEWNNCFTPIRKYFLGETSLDAANHWHITYEIFDKRPSYENTKARVLQLITPEAESDSEED